MEGRRLSGEEAAETPARGRVFAEKRQRNTSEEQMSSRRTGSENTSGGQRPYHAAAAGLGQHAWAGVSCGCGCGTREKHTGQSVSRLSRSAAEAHQRAVSVSHEGCEKTGYVSRCDGTGAPGCGLVSAGSEACRKTGGRSSGRSSRSRSRQLNAGTTSQRSDNSPWAVDQGPQGKALSLRDERQCLREERQWENTH